VLCACQQDGTTTLSGSSSSSESNSSDSGVTFVDNADDISVTLENLDGDDVYLVFTNTDQSNAISPPTISLQTTTALGATVSASRSSGSSETLVRIESSSAATSEFSFDLNELPSLSRKAISAAVAESDESSTSYAIGDSTEFYVVANEDDDDEANTDAWVTSTLKSITTYHGKTLYVWVQDDSWENSNIKTYEVNQTMVDAFAEQFLANGDDNDIYEWVTGILGEPWGEHNYSNLIADTDEIHILMTDIGEDDIPSGSVTLGFFYALDTFIADETSTYTENSNEKLMFYIDSVLLATPSGDSWEITDTYPSVLISTLAHEFQHMIYFYQKFIADSNASELATAETWLNELASMAIQDMLADKIESDGPRGVSYTDGTAGASNNYSGRLPRYNYYNDASITDWEGELTNYSVNYAFGAYLMRNYGGASFLRSLVHSSNGNSEAIDDALSAQGYSEDFNTVLQQFGVANLLSDQTNTDEGYWFNSGDWFTSIYDGIDYNLGSINLYNYIYYPYDSEDGNDLSSVNQVGPFIHQSFTEGFQFEISSNTYYLLGSDLSGDYSLSIEGLDESVEVTIVTKDSDS
jgi:hypothetical protein